MKEEEIFHNLFQKLGSLKRINFFTLQQKPRSKRNVKSDKILTFTKISCQSTDTIWLTDPVLFYCTFNPNIRTVSDKTGGSTYFLIACLSNRSNTKRCPLGHVNSCNNWSWSLTFFQPQGHLVTLNNAATCQWDVYVHYKYFFRTEKNIIFFSSFSDFSFFY